MAARTSGSSKSMSPLLRSIEVSVVSSATVVSGVSVSGSVVTDPVGSEVEVSSPSPSSPVSTTTMATIRARASAPRPTSSPVDGPDRGGLAGGTGPLPYAGYPVVGPYPPGPAPASAGG